jgi:hypothetical protein
VELILVQSSEARTSQQTILSTRGRAAGPRLSNKLGQGMTALNLFICYVIGLIFMHAHTLEI